MKLNIGDRVRIRVRFASRNVWAHGRIVGEAPREDVRKRKTP